MIEKIIRMILSILGEPFTNVMVSFRNEYKFDENEMRRKSLYQLSPIDRNNNPFFPSVHISEEGKIDEIEIYFRPEDNYEDIKYVIEKIIEDIQWRPNTRSLHCEGEIYKCEETFIESTNQHICLEQSEGSCVVLLSHLWGE